MIKLWLGMLNIAPVESALIFDAVIVEVDVSPIPSRLPNVESDGSVTI